MTIVDVRILVEGASDVEVVSKALQGLALGSEYNITISAIIPTTNLEIAKSAAAGADLLIIATDADRVGRELAERMFRELGELVGQVERMKIPMGHDLEHIDVELVRKELKNTLVRAGLKSLQVLPEYMALRNQLFDLKGKHEMLMQENEELKKNYQELEQKYGELLEEYSQVLEENNRLKESLKKRANVFKLTDIWKELFGETTPPDERYIAEAVEKLNLGGKIIVGQGHIYSEDEDLIVELLRIVHLSLSMAKTQKEEPQVEEEKTPEEIEEPEIRFEDF
ncbi:MAG TPA: topoisomerase [Thermococcaceae archaeon]|nr:toprim domain-containing protein [Thermococcus sibiricus]KUK17119.1 MAG: TOPRIM-domain-containing protein, potential nuclease [Thermococcus sibiricus]KUK28591.1 MAG: TOPRIM-domain-containing protein, potential nuclease [Thermococcus sp. 40_45]HII67487.1 topoisomerase [Thermococcaceae archaeon]